MDLQSEAVIPEENFSNEVVESSSEIDPEIRATFETPDEVEIHKINPYPEEIARPGLFHRHRIRGSMRVPTAPRRAVVGKALLADLNHGFGAMCFDPGFGVRLRRGKQEIGLLICYWCGNVQVVIPKTGSGLFTFGRSSIHTLRKELRRGGVGWLWFWRGWFDKVE